jgi:hypothetical protein
METRAAGASLSVLFNFMFSFIVGELEGLTVLAAFIAASAQFGRYGILGVLLLQVRASCPCCALWSMAFFCSLPGG